MAEEKKPDENAQGQNKFSAPSISLPKGGGAVRGIGEKFAANPVTGTGSMSVPIAVSPGRSGFGPQLSLSYDSGAGNGPFGFGWNLSLPSITRKTDKGLPQYRDAEESDVFILSGAEDLTPVLKKQGNDWEPEKLPKRTIGADTYRIKRYRPRIEGLFARIERWTKVATGEVHWRSISRDNITTLYGKNNNSRIFDPADPFPANPTRVFSWLICESYDDKGNAIIYRYAAEKDDNVDRGQANERNRVRTANRYLERIKYGNRVSRLIQPDLTKAAWMFEVVFDYGEHNLNDPKPGDLGHRFCRKDPFSSYRPGFEVRTYRLCRRVLMFHHFPDEEGIGNDCLVRSTDFAYSYEKNPADVRNPIYSFLLSVTQTGYKRKSGGYLNRSLPPVEFEYTKPVVQDIVEEVDPASLENLPIGVEGGAYQWTDLHGEGIPGILTEQAGAWFYKRNVGPISKRPVEFAPLERVAVKPNLAIAGGAQFMDLAGDGQPDLVALDGPMPGLYEHDDEEGWRPFRPFTSRLNRDMRDPNLKFIDLDGDGHADVLVAEDEAFVWHASLAEAGFGPARRVAQALDEEQGPRLVFADGTQSIYLADMCGDGLVDLARIRNGEVCYWPNLGYGRFGARITMDNSPRFDTPDQFDQRRIRLADIDGSGATDIIYLSRDGVRLYFNRSGNSWSEPQVLRLFPRVDDVVNIVPTDLFGNGTACLVWSSPQTGDARRQMRYIDLMGGQKPHLLIKSINNLGAETHVQYASSTKFYLADRMAGKPWITKLPFPVHCVEKVTVTDKWRKTAFSSTYSYHHGYFDGAEREFRGFGRVEQVDVETYGQFAAGNAQSPYITQDHLLYQPPVKTVTWFHTGVFLDRERILRHFEEEYFPNRLKEAGFSINPDYAFSERDLPEPDLLSLDLSAEEWREALRAGKGMTLRQEVYELDVDALADRRHAPVRLFSAAVHNCRIQRLQPRGNNRHAVFLATESEALTYHYELDLHSSELSPDPRIAHTVNLTVDEYGQPLQTVAVAYPRVRPFRDTDTTPTFPGGLEKLVRDVQKELHLAYTETRYTVDFDENDRDNYRLRVPYEVKTYELTGIRPDDEEDRKTTDPWDDVYFTLAELRGFQLTPAYQPDPTNQLMPVEEIPYHRLPNGTTPEKRLVEHVRMLFFKDNPDDPGALEKPLPFGQLGRLGLPYETYKLALTGDLLNAVFSDAAGNKLDKSPVQGTTTARQLLGNPDVSGYFSGEELVKRFAPLPAAELAGQYWTRSGIVGFSNDAAQHFYLPERYTDPFGKTTVLEYDGKYDLYLRRSTDPVGNRTSVEEFDFRVLQLRVMKDMNDNLSEVYFDVPGMVVAMALKGKGAEADNLDGFDDVLANPALDECVRFFFMDAAYDEAKSRRWLANATARFVYHFGETFDSTGKVIWGTHPARACGIVRERHAARLAAGEASPLQVSFECSDGGGNVLMKKIQAEPETKGGPLRWIANGKTILNNKGKPVKQYEPYFSQNGHRCEEPREEGVTPIMYYDAPGRLVRTEMPDGSFSRVEFSPWHVKNFDANDTVRDSRWYRDRGSPDPQTTREPTDPGKRSAWLAARHADTPAVTHFDSLGREVIAVAHNRFADANGRLKDEKYVTFTKLDAEGKPLWIRDARGNLVMQYITPAKANNDPGDAMPDNAVPCYDIAGNLLFRHSMDAGDRWMLMDAAGKPMLAWDFNEFRGAHGAVIPQKRIFLIDYDALHRPVAHWLTINNGPSALIEAFEYCDTGRPNGALNLDEAKRRNLIGQAVKHWDPGGLATVERIDLSGQAAHVTRTVVKVVPDPALEPQLLDWNVAVRNNLLESETFAQVAEYDALGRMTRLYNWHRGVGSLVAVYEPLYNRRGLLQSETLTVRARKTTGGFDRTAKTTSMTAIAEIRCNAKGQKEFLRLGNNTLTQYDYDPLTFRLKQIRTTRPTDAKDFPNRRSNLSDPGIVQQLLYTYDPVGNIVEIYDDAYEPVFFKNRRVEPRSRYTYDALYRLIEAEGREQAGANSAPTHRKDPPWAVDSFPVTNQTLRNYTQRYSYDAAGNFIEMGHIPGAGSGWTRHYSMQPDTNRLNRTWYGSNTNTLAAVAYHHDTHGNMLNLNRVEPPRNPDDEWGLAIRWDWRDMILGFDLGGGGVARYYYGMDKQRTRKHITRNGGVVEDRIYLGGYEIYRRYRGNNPKPVEEIESHHMFEGKQRVLLVDDVFSSDNSRIDGLKVKAQTLFRYQYGNHLGSVGLELDEAAKIISYEEFHPYGTCAYRLMNAAKEAPPKRYRYTGMERDEESGLNYHGVRYYSEWLMRWIAGDPAGFIDGPNFYIYCHNNPINKTDQGGMQASLGGRDSVSYSAHLIDPRSANFEVSSDTMSSVLSPPPGKSPDLWEEWFGTPSWDTLANLPFEQKFLFPLGTYDTMLDRSVASAYANAEYNYSIAGSGSVMVSAMDRVAAAGKGLGYHLLYLAPAMFYVGEHILGTIAETIGGAQNYAIDALNSLIPGFRTSYEDSAAVLPMLGAELNLGRFLMAEAFTQVRLKFWTASMVRTSSAGIKVFDQLSPEWVNYFQQQGRHVLNWTTSEGVNFWTVSGFGGQIGHTEYAGALFLRDLDLLYPGQSLLVQGYFAPCSRAAINCHQLLDFLARERGIETLYDTRNLSAEFGTSNFGSRFYGAGRGFFKQGSGKYVPRPFYHPQILKDF